MWVAEVVQEIRRTGKYEMEQRLNLAVKALEASDIETQNVKQLVEQLTEEHTRELSTLQEAHAIAAKKTTHADAGQRWHSPGVPRGGWRAP